MWNGIEWNRMDFKHHLLYIMQLVSLEGYYQFESTTALSLSPLHTDELIGTEWWASLLLC